MKRKKARNFQEGGAVRGPGTATSDSILARLSNGEYVLPAKAVPLVGLQQLEQARALANFVGGARSDSGLAQTAGRFVDASLQGGAATRMNPAMFGLRSMVESRPAEAATLDNPEAHRVMRENDAYRAMRGYAFGGLVDNGLYSYDPTSNSYASKAPGTSNDLSLANSMSAAADRMKAMREGPAQPSPLQPNPAQNPQFGLNSLLNPGQQAMDAYKTARSGANSLDVASGRFDREYVPRFAGGGMVWTPSELLKVYGPNPQVSASPGVDMARVAQNRAADMTAAKAAMSGPASSAPLVPGGYPNQPAASLGSRLAAGLGSIGSRLAGGIGMMLYPSELGAGTLDSPEAQRAIAENQRASFSDSAVGAGPDAGTTGKAVAPPMPQAQPPVGGLPSPEQEAARRMTVGQLTTGLDRAALSQSGATPIQGTDVYRSTSPAPGFGTANPNRIPAPGQNAGTTTYTVPGVSAMGGGAPGRAEFQGLPRQGGAFGYVGTPETAGMTQEQATAYNVANLNRQYEALRSLNEARNPSGGGAGGIDQAAFLQMANPFYAPGQSYGDETLNRDRFMRQFDTRKRSGRMGLSKANEDIQQAQGQRMQGLAQIAQMQAKGQPGAAISPYQAGQLANERERLSIDRGRYQDESAYRQQQAKATAEQKAYDAWLKKPQADREMAANQLLAALTDAQMKGDKATYDKLMPLANLMLNYRPPPTDPIAQYLQQQQQR